MAEILIPTPEGLIAQKVISAVRRRAQPKGDTDRRDLKVLLLAFPQLKAESGPALERLKTARADADAITEWKKLVQAPIEAENCDESEW